MSVPGPEPLRKWSPPSTPSAARSSSPAFDYQLDLEGTPRMTRRKGEITGHMNERDFPHLVELALPPGGFRSQTSEFEAFHREPRIRKRRGRGRHEGGQFYIRFCFPDAATADAFHDRFGRANAHLTRQESPELTPQRGRSASTRPGLSPTTSWCRRISSSRRDGGFPGSLRRPPRGHRTGVAGAGAQSSRRRISILQSHWQSRLARPIVLRDGTRLETLLDAGTFITGPARVFIIAMPGYARWSC